MLTGSTRSYRKPIFRFYYHTCAHRKLQNCATIDTCQNDPKIFFVSSRTLFLSSFPASVFAFVKTRALMSTSVSQQVAHFGPDWFNKHTAKPLEALKLQLWSNILVSVGRLVPSCTASHRCRNFQHCIVTSLASVCEAPEFKCHKGLALTWEAVLLSHITCPSSSCLVLIPRESLR